MIETRERQSNFLFEENLDYEIEIVLDKRNLSWSTKEEIPGWVDLNTVGLDQFFTNEDVAKKYIDYMYSFLSEKNIDISDCIFVEPSAGSGSFFNHLPESQRIGIDLMPLTEGVQAMDFLDWALPRNIEDKTIIFVGNPPFGYRSWLALLFVNHAAKFADYVFFILPMAFQSDGKGSPKNRVNGLKLVHSEIVPHNSFFTLDNSPIKINALFQVWEKGRHSIPDYTKANEFLDIFTIDNRPERLCGKDKKSKADFFLQRTYYSDYPTPVFDFEKVQYGCGYGVIIKKQDQKNEIKELFNNVNWDNYSNLAAHNCRHISMYHIQKVFLENFKIS